MFDRQIYFDSVRASLFAGILTQDQVTGQDAILSCWETFTPDQDLRWLAYMLATTYHETAATMLPIEEYGRGGGMPYGVPDPETGQTYYGRGFVQLTWRENYRRADDELGLINGNSCEWHADNALNPAIAARIMYAGMSEGWFRVDDQGPHTLPRYFHGEFEDPFNAREIINGDRYSVPTWSNGQSIGELVSDYYWLFLEALKASQFDSA